MSKAEELILLLDKAIDEMKIVNDCLRKLFDEIQDKLEEKNK